MRHTLPLSRVASTQVLPGQMEVVSRWPVVLLHVWLGLTGSWTTTPYNSTSMASPSPDQITSRPTPGSGWPGSCSHKTFAVSLTIFPLILAMFWQLRDLFCSSLSTCLMLRAAGETPNPAEPPGMQSICNESQLQRCQQGLFQTERGNEGGGGGGSNCRACVKGQTGKEERQHWLKWKKTTRGKLCRDHSSEASPPALHGAVGS